MEVSTADIKQLREQTGAGIMDCRKALVDAGGDAKKAAEILKQKSFMVAARPGRVTRQGLVECYIHTGGRIGAMIELNCETDFVARTGEFKELAHDIAMQVAALDPKFISSEEVPAGADSRPEVDCLLVQQYIKNPEMTVKDLIAQAMAKTGENVKVSRFVRFEVGE